MSTTSGELRNVDELLDAISNRYRRQILVGLLGIDPQDAEGRDPSALVSDDTDPEFLEIELVHNHLPKLDDLGLIAWNRETNEIHKGPDWETIAPLLILLYDHQRELPDGLL